MSGAREARERAGYSVAAVARRLKVSAGYLYRAERGKLPYCLALRLSALYGVALDTLLPPATGSRVGSPGQAPRSGRGRGAESLDPFGAAGAGGVGVPERPE